MDAAALKAGLAARARELGFAAMGVTRPEAIPKAPERLEVFVGEGRHGQMGWMEERREWRGNPAALWGEARSVIMLADSYTPDINPLTLLENPERGAIASYAWGRDYHDVVKGRLKTLGSWLASKGGGALKVFVDTAPVMEKPLAEAAGLGWQGKHTNLLSRDFGNWVFLGSLFTTIELPVDAPAQDRCGNCRACLDICPTGAFPAAGQLDARRCISYLTIEHHGPVPLELRARMGNRIYGCDDCLAICPWNKFAVEAREARYAAREGVIAPDLAELAALDDAGFRARFSGSPIKRIGRDRFVRNVLYAIGNSGRRRLLPVAEGLRDDPDPVVAEAAAWAVERLKGGASCGS